MSLDGLWYIQSKIDARQEKGLQPIPYSRKPTHYIFMSYPHSLTRHSHILPAQPTFSPKITPNLARSRNFSTLTRPKTIQEISSLKP